jgi:hypothetical protein
VLLLDNFEAHVTEASRRCVETALNSQLSLLPPNCTHVCQPLDVGIMGPFKSILRSRWLKESVHDVMDLDGNLLDEDVVRSAADKRLATINRAIDAWNEISADSIRKSFAKAIPHPAWSLTVTEAVV